MTQGIFLSENVHVSSRTEKVSEKAAIKETPNTTGHIARHNNFLLDRT